jgi:ERCC4-type nuclease
MSGVIVYDHRERRSGVPQRLALLGFELEPRDLGSADYILSPRLAVIRKSDTAQLQHATAAIPDGVTRGVVARLARQGVAVLPAEDADDAAAWIARLARQERGPGARPPSLGRKPRDPSRVAEDLVARLPGVSHVGAGRLLEHFGSVRGLAAASAEEIRAVRGFGPKRSAAVEAALAYRRTTPARAA